MAKDLLKEIARMGSYGSPPQEIADALGLDSLDSEQLAAHRLGSARGRVRLKQALAKAAGRGDARCAALLAASLGEGDTEDEIVKFRRLWRAQEAAEAGEVLE